MNAQQAARRQARLLLRELNWRFATTPGATDVARMLWDASDGKPVMQGTLQVRLSANGMDRAAVKFAMAAVELLS